MTASPATDLEATALLDGLDESLLRIRRVFQRPGYRRRLLEGLSLDVEPATLRLLRVVQQCDEPPSVGTVAQTLTLDPSTASRLSDGAAQLGFVERRACTDDRRKARLHLTAQGEKVLAEVTARRRQLLAEVTEQWIPDELHRLSELLSRLQEAFDQLERDR